MSSQLNPIVFNFTSPMNQAVTEALITVNSSVNGAIAGTFVWNAAGTQLTFTPNAPGYGSGATVTADLAAGATSANGVCTFVAEQVVFDVDCILPLIVNVATQSGLTALVVEGDPVVITFSEAMNQAVTQALVTVTSDLNGVVAGTFAWDGTGTILTFTPTGLYGTGASVTVDVGPNVQNLAGTCIDPTAVQHVFTTECFDPVIVVICPDGGTDLTTTEPVIFSFSEDMDQASVEALITATSTVNGVVAGTFLWNTPSQLTFTPNAPGYGNAATVTVQLDGGYMTVAGVPHALAVTGSFTTVA